MSRTRARPIAPGDIPACIALRPGNVPRLFTERELAAFEGWLAALTSPFLVLEDGPEMLACGGYGPGLDRIDMRLSV